MTRENELDSIPVREPVKRMELSMTKRIIKGGPKIGSMLCMMSKPTELEPKKIRVKKPAMWLSEYASRATREKVVRKPR